MDDLEIIKTFKVKAVPVLKTKFKESFIRHLDDYLKDEPLPEEVIVAFTDDKEMQCDFTGLKEYWTCLASQVEILVKGGYSQDNKDFYHIEQSNILEIYF